MFIKNIPNEYNIDGINIIKANSMGNNTVQQKDINWLCNKPLTEELVNKCLKL